MKSERGPPATLGSSAAAGVRLIVWCKECRHRVEPDLAEQITSPMLTEMAARYSAGIAISGKRPTRTLIEIALKQAGLIARAEFDFKEDGLSQYFARKAYRFNLAHIEPSLDI